MAALHRTFPLAEMDDISVLVAENLDFNVPRLNDIFLDVHFATFERALGFTCRVAQGGFEVRIPVDPAHTLATAACRCLYDYRESDFAGDAPCLGRIAHTIRGSWHDRHAGRDGDFARLGLRPHHSNALRRGTDEGNSLPLTSRGEFGILAQESVAWMDRICPVLLGRIENAIDPKITLRGRRRADVLRLVGHLDKERRPVGV